MTKKRKIWAKCRGVLCSGVVTHAATKVHAAEKGSFAAAWSRGGPLAILRFAEAKLLFITHKFLCFFCFVILSFRGLVYWVNEDPISVYKGPFMLKM